MLIRKSFQKGTFNRTIFYIIALIIIGVVSYVSYIYVNNQLTTEDNKQTVILQQIAIKTAESAKEAKKRQPVYITLPGAKPIKAIVEDSSLVGSIWIIVSKSHPISVDYIPKPIKIPDVKTRTDKSNDEQSVRSTIETPLKNMFTAAMADGHDLMIGSGYRSAALQTVYFNNLASSVGETAANQAIARPGESEHQTGLVVDISTVSQYCYLSECFETTTDGLWLANNSHKYGFILRYPKGKEIITGYQYEPWHFRYVGIDLATALYESGLTLDEAWQYLVKADATLKQNGAI